MPLPWPEIRDKAIAFSREWQDAESERAEAQTFWNEFFAVFGVPRRRVATFEEPVKKLGTKRGRIDAFWKGQLVVEHKSRGENLDRAFDQALDYFPGIPDRDLPKYVLVSDFAQFRLYDLDAGSHSEFKLKDLHKHIKKFGFIAGYAPQEIKAQDPVNIKAAERMGKLHDLLKASGYEGHDLEVLLVRLVFCMFADDTGIFTKQSFRDWLDTRTAEDGSDLGQNLALLFQVLNTKEDKRQKNLDEQLAAFAYINGKLFEETLKVAAFDRKMRSTLLDCCALNWGSVSPAIFGALFQSIMDEKARRNLGAHYTSEENILKLIKPLFLDDLWAEFNKVKTNKNRLFEFHKKLRSLVFLDPACGCGLLRAAGASWPSHSLALRCAGARAFRTATAHVLLHLVEPGDLFGSEDGLHRVECRLMMGLELAMRVPHRDRGLTDRGGIGVLGFERPVERVLRLAGRLHQRLACLASLVVDRLPLSLLFVGETEMFRDPLDRRAARAARTEAGAAGTPAGPAHVSAIGLLRGR